MVLVAHFMDEEGKIFGRDEKLLINFGISDKEIIRQKIENYLAENNEIKVLTATDIVKVIDSKKVKIVDVSEKYFGGESFSINVSWY